MKLTDTQDFKLHFERLKSATLNRLSVEEIPEWICKHTYIKGDNYSFKNHEYQEQIVRDSSQEQNIQKCSQVGISEVSARKALALCALLPSFTIAYTLPTAGFASTFMRTRIDPVIQSSPYLSGLIHSTVDNAEVKRLGDSYLYLKGSQSSNAPISIPCDMLIFDEINFSDPEVISQYHSRITHSPYKRKIRLSTPTVPGRGISKEFEASRKHFYLAKCNHCNHWYIPDYFRDVKVPEWTKDLKEITKNNIHKTRYREAVTTCPNCGKNPEFLPEHRQWVCENNNAAHVAAGYQVTPFDAPAQVKPFELILSSTVYKRYIDFINFTLGLPAEDKESTLVKEELLDLLISTVDAPWGSYVMGLDMGMLCHCIIAFSTHDGFLIIVHTEIIPVHKVKTRRIELARKYQIRMSVIDSQPYTETVLAMQAEDKNLFGAVYMRSKNIETHSLREKAEDESEGQVAVRQVNINRDKAFDAFMDAIRAKMILKVKDENDDIWADQLCDMRRMKEWTADAEMSFVWRKSEDGNDHFHHASLYAHIASQLLGTSRSSIILPFLTTTFKVIATPEVKPILLPARV